MKSIIPSILLTLLNATAFAQNNEGESSFLRINDMKQENTIITNKGFPSNNNGSSFLEKQGTSTKSNERSRPRNFLRKVQRGADDQPHVPAIHMQKIIQYFGGKKESSIKQNENEDSPCAQLELDLLTDWNGDETEVWLIDDATQDWIWNDNDFGDNELRQFSTCLDPSGCFTLQVFDSKGDGIYAPGGISVWFQQESVYIGGDFAGEALFRFGNGCSHSGVHR